MAISGPMKEELKKYLEGDDRPFSRQMKAKIDKLQQQINHWGESGTYRKSYVKKLVADEKRKLAEEYKQSLKQHAEENYRKRRRELEEERDKELQKNAVAELIRKQEMEFQAGLMTDDEIKEKVKNLMDDKALTAEKVQNFKNYSEVQAVVKEMQNRQMKGTVAKVRENLKDLPSIYFDKKEAPIYEEVAAYYESVPQGKILAPREGEDMQIDIDNLIDDETPLVNLAD